MFILQIISFILVSCNLVELTQSASAFLLSNSKLSSSSSYMPRQDRCFLEGKVMYNNFCYQLNTQGPCAENEKLVMDIEAASRVNPIFQPICVQNACADRDILWSEDGYCYTPEAAQDLCRIKGTSPQVDIFGEANCDCIKNPPHARMPNEKPDSPCHKLYTRAQCKQSEILVESNNLKTACIHNHCFRKGSNYIRWIDKQCYRLGSQGPCDDNQLFTILENTNKPGCKHIDPLNPLNVIIVPQNCNTDHTGNCADEFSVMGEHYRAELLRSAERARKRKKKNC